MLVNRMPEVKGDIDDVTLMIRVRDHACRESFERLVAKWRGRIEAFCYQMCGNIADAEDLAQEVFHKLFASRSGYQPTAQFSTFVWTIAANQCRDHARSQRRRGRSLAEAIAQLTFRHASSKSENLDDESRLAIQSAVWHLPAHYREVVVLRHYEGLKFSEIAQMLAIPRGTVASRMAKALRILETDLICSGLLPANLNAKDDQRDDQ